MNATHSINRFKKLLPFFSVAAATLCWTAGLSQAQLIEDFDGGGNTPFDFTTSGGSPPPAIMAGGPTGSFARMTYLTTNNNRSIAFNENPTVSGPAPDGLVLDFDFRMTTDADNNAAGGCCGFAADGLGIGLFATATYGTTGPTNPSGPVWETPSFADSFTVGLDIFPGGADGNRVTLNWVGAQIAQQTPAFDLNTGQFHRATVSILPDGADALVTMDIIEDVHGAGTPHNIFTDQSIPGMDLSLLPSYRLIAGGRTGGAFNNGDLDNISLASAFVIPEPSSLVLATLGLLALLGFTRRRRK